jgi:putative flippase GtrA
VNVNRIEDGDRLSNFRAVRDSAKIYFDIIKFSVASGMCAIVDFGLFAIFSSLVFGTGSGGILKSVVLARILSGICNFTLNRFVVFKSSGKLASVKYLALFLILMFLSARLTMIFTALIGSALVTKLIVDGALFIASFIVQRTLVFGKGGDRRE